MDNFNQKSRKTMENEKFLSHKILLLVFFGAAGIAIIVLPRLEMEIG